MKLADLIARVKLGVDRAEYAVGDGMNPVDAGYLQIVNEAQREICEAYNWSFMHSGMTTALIMPNEDRAVLPPMKCLNGRTPITLISQDWKMEFPVEILPRWEYLKRLPQIGSSAQLPVPGSLLTAPEQELFAWIDWNEPQLAPPEAPPPPNATYAAVMHLPGIISATNVRYFNVDCFVYLPDFVVINAPMGQNQSNALTEMFPEMLIAKAKSIALAGVNDPLAAELDALYQSKFKTARQSDSYRMATAQKLRM